jgi:hypothetical protein
VTPFGQSVEAVTKVLAELAAHVDAIVLLQMDADHYEAWILCVHAACAHRMGIAVPASIDARIVSYAPALIEQIAQTYLSLIEDARSAGPYWKLAEAVDLARFALEHATATTIRDKAKDAWGKLQAIVEAIRSESGPAPS